MKLRYTLILGTTRINNESQKVALFLKKLLEESGKVEVDYLDLGQVDIPIMEERLHKLEDPPQDLVTWNDNIRNAQGIIIVAPEYKRSYPGSLKNFFDYLPAQVFRYKPVAITTVSSGVLGGVACLGQLRLTCLALGGMPTPDHLRVPFVKELFPDDGTGPDEEFAGRASSFLEEFEKYVVAFAGI